MTSEGIGTLLLGLTSVTTLVTSLLTGKTARSTHTLVNGKSDRQIEEIRGLKDEVMRQKALPAEPKKDGAHANTTL
jgi:hypothetical protein